VSGAAKSLAELPRLAIRLDGSLPPRDCVRLAQLAEANHFSALWLAENPFSRSALPSAAACAAVTRRLLIGAGIVNPFTRHPSLIAMEWGAFDELAEGRTMLGIGAGIAAAVRRIGFGWERPLSAVSEAIHIVRGLLRGDEVTYRGRVFAVDRVRLDYRPPRPDLPIFMAAVGERSLALCGEIADGLIVSNMLPAGYAARAAAIVRDSAVAAGRPMPEIVQYVPCAARPDRDEARRIVKPPLARMLTAFWALGEERPNRREIMVRSSGIPRAEFAAAIGRLGRGEAADRVIDDRFVEAFTIAGTADDCLARAAIYRQAGVGELALNFVGPDPAGDIQHLGQFLAGNPSSFSN
jgi:5,10-methylenetetrahydromethanopterin reductase